MLRTVVACVFGLGLIFGLPAVAGHHQHGKSAEKAEAHQGCEHARHASREKAEGHACGEHCKHEKSCEHGESCDCAHHARHESE